MCDHVKINCHTIEAGPSVRADYLTLPRDLLELARGFNIELPPERQHDATTLVLAIECVDRILDALPDAAARTQFAANVLAALEGNPPDSLAAEPRERLFQLHEMIQRRNVSDAFCRITERILRNSEQMRATRSAAFYVLAAVREGRWMVELLLLTLGDSVTPRFRSFMRQVAGAANLGDKLRDARCDFALGELAIKPGLMLHLRLGCGMFWRICALAVRFCAYRKILAWGLKSLYHELALPRHRALEFARFKAQ
jgi:hypothetical protein